MGGRTWATWLRAHDGTAEGEDAYTGLEGFSFFLPVVDWGRGNYQFGGLVRSVIAFDEWKVSVGTMSFENESTELDVLATEQAWVGGEPPRVGQDID